MGFATVRLATKGARLTNLPVVGGEVAVGQRVAIDYSAGVPPVVRPIAEEQQPTVGFELPEGPEVTVTKRRDCSCRLTLTSNVTVTKDTWQTISWHAVEYQTDTFWTSGTDITLPFDGLYIFLADLSWSASHDHWDLIHKLTGNPYGPGDKWILQDYQTYKEIFEMVFTSTTNGDFGYNQDCPIDSEPSIGKMHQGFAMHFAASGEVIQFKVNQSTELATMDLVPVSEGGNIIAPRLTIQWMGAPE
jgi:hypothetical protein